MEDILRTALTSLTINELRRRAKQVLNIKQKKNSKKDELVEKIVRRMKRREIRFKEDINKRKEYKKYFDEFGLKFNKKKGFVKREKNDDVYERVKHLFKAETSTYTINETFGRFIKKYNTTEKIYTVDGNNLHAYSTIIKKIFNKAITKADGSKFKNNDKINITAMHPNFQIPIRSKNIPISQAFDEFLYSLSNKMEYKDCDITDVEFHFYIIEIPEGGRKDGLKVIKEEDIKNKRSIIRIINRDNLCLARSIVTALSINNGNVLSEKLNIEPLTDTQVKYLKMGRNLQKDLAEKLHDLCQIPKEVCSLAEVKKFEEFLDIQIFIFDRDNFYQKIYSGEEKHVYIYLYKDKNHFNVIASITGFLGKRNYCRFCDKTYKDQHRCNRKCNCCFQEGKCKENDIYCKECFRIFKGQTCFENHKNFKVCDKIWKCLTCKQVINREQRKPEAHECGERICKNCRLFVKDDHHCYIKPAKTKGGICKEECEDGKLCINCRTFTEKYLFFDVETDQSSGTHEVNLVICHDFNGEETIFKTSDDFCKWLFDRRHQNYTVLAHYGKGFDFQFLAKYCINNGLKPYTIYNGNKIQFMEIKALNLRFIDSINFTLIPLRDFPKTFGLNELKKGYFPHYFNTMENQNYTGKIPDKHYYGYNQLSKNQRDDFDKWYDQDKQFNFQKDFIDYCRSDVDILRRGCLQFRKLFLDLFNIDPFCYITLSSVCMAIFRGNFLKDRTIGIDEQVIQKDRYSKKSIAWLDYISDSEKLNIRHALNGREKKIGKYKVDGYCKANKTVYQFHGCYWHGCPKCYKEDTINVNKQVCMKDLYDNTKKINKYIMKHGYNLVTLWECDFNKEMKKYLNREFVEPMNPRDAFYGGRCEPTKLKYETNENEKIRYIDVCSLYPTVNYFDYYPIDHPTKLYNPKEYDKRWYGLIKCKVLPPKGLYHPVLPYRGNKLMFTLCRSCNKNEECKHTDEERCLIGTWTTDEIKLAKKKGYKIKAIYEVWHFENKSNEIFKEYVETFMKIKLETDEKWSKNFKTKKDYKRTVKEKMGITLEKIEANPGLRFISKICLNSLWGKFGQKKYAKHTEYVLELAEFYKIILNDQIKDLTMVFPNENMVEMNYNIKDEFLDNNFNTNIFISCFTTSSARIRLYKMLDRLGDKVVYYDTDSIVYIDDGTNTVETGCMLGEWTDELDENYIKYWISGASKDYSYILDNGEIKGKIKGFKMNLDTENDLSFENRKKIIEKEIDCIDVTDKQFRIQKDRSIITKDIEKKYKLSFDKRRILENFDTVPFGF